jgi:enterochelin esterase-like enzyme
VTGIGASVFERRAWGDVDPAWRPRDLDVREIAVDGALSRRFVLGVPRHLGAGDRVPVAVLLHGLGETGDERTGAWAWFERYGLGTSYDRLRAAGPLRGLVFACPYMPNLPVADPRAFDAYAAWIVETVLPRVAREAPVLDGPRGTFLGGCSLGGHFSIEVLLRRFEVFGAWGGVQTAIHDEAGRRYAALLAAATARSSPRDLFIETSTADPFRSGNEALSRALTRAGVASTFALLPGPHDQGWLRATGTARLIQWLDERR